MSSKLPAKCQIVVDTREQKPLFDTTTMGDKDVACYIVEKLDEGDYGIKEIPDLVVVERKLDGLELWGNLTRNKDRFLREVERLQKYKHKFIVIEQTYDEFLDHKNWKPIASIKKRLTMIATVEGWLLYLTEKENIHFIFAGRHAARITKRILTKFYSYERKRLKGA